MPLMTSPTKDPGETPVLTISPFESDPRILVLTYPADWNSGATGSQFFQAVKQLRDRCNSGDEPLPPNLIGAVFDAHASGWEIRTEDQFSPIFGLIKIFHEQRIPFAISGSNETVINLFMLMRCGFLLLADSLAEAAGLCDQIGRAIRDKDAESIQQIWGEHRNAFMGRNGRHAPTREVPLSAISDMYLRPRDN